MLFATSTDRFADTARALNSIRLYDDVIEVVRVLRQAGMPRHIASNQQAGCAQHMSERLGYKALGFAKPDVAYFNRVLQAILSEHGVSATAGQDADA